MTYLVTIPVAAVATGVPAGTIRRWIVEGKLAKYGYHKPFQVDLRSVERLRDTSTRSRPRP